MTTLRNQIGKYFFICRRIFLFEVVLVFFSLSGVCVAVEKNARIESDGCFGQIGIRDVIAARRSTNEFLIAQLRQESAEADKEIIDNYYLPVFSVTSRAGKNSSNEINKNYSGTEESKAANKDSYLGLHTAQRLPGGGSLGLSMNKDWGRNRAHTSSAGDSLSQTTQHYYQVEAKQPLLQGAGASASAELSIGKLSQKIARLNHLVFLQDDLLKSISLYTELVSSQQNVLRAKRSLKASMEFLKATEAQVSQGVLAKSEIDQAEYAASQSKLELAYAEQEQKNALDRLFIFSGISLKAEESVKALSIVSIDEYFLAGNFPQETTEIELAKLNLQVSKNNKVLAKSTNEAELNALASYGKGWGRRSYSSEEGDIRGNGWRAQSYIGLEFKKVLNDYPARTALKKAALDLEEKELALRDIQSRVRIQQVIARREFESARRNLQLVKKKIDVSRKNFANERFKIEAGRSTAFLVYAAQNSLDQAESEYIDSTSRYVLAAAQLYKEFEKVPVFVESLSLGCAGE